MSLDLLFLVIASQIIFVWSDTKLDMSSRVVQHKKGKINISPSVHLSEAYNLEEVPRDNTYKPLMVNFSINLKSILAVDEPHQTISLESTVRMVWFDKRIKVSIDPANDQSAFDKEFGQRYILLNRDPVDSIWFPDIYIDKAKALRVPVYQIPPTYLRIYENGMIMYSARVNYDISCPMNFENYPVDRQQCDIKFESWGHPSHILMFMWNKQDCKVNEKIILNQHAFQVQLLDGPIANFSTGSFSSVTLRLVLTRKLTYHLLRTYLPSVLFVSVAWFSMFVPLNHVPGRVAMSMTTMLTLSSMFNALTTITPPISYTTKLDIWMICCILFIFATHVEFTVVIFLKYYLQNIPGMQFERTNSSKSTNSNRSGKNILDSLQDNVWKRNEKLGKENHVSIVKVKPLSGKEKRKNEINDDDSADDEEILQARAEKSEKIIKRIEKWSVIVYLFSLICFNIIYWWELSKAYPGSVKNAEIIV